EIYYPAPFMGPLGPRKIGPLFELRIYTYASGDVPKVMAAWGDAIEERVKFSPLVGAWYSDIGGLNKWAHMWAYESFEHRMSVREETRAKGVWPPSSPVSPLKQENKLLWAADFSPIQ
ncbi:MAG: NIPSNAP family protein, partial [Chloroflexi bacterium]|nr:NIPSNAP family protein [Chloroflexota bacterium]